MSGNDGNRPAVQVGAGNGSNGKHLAALAEAGHGSIGDHRTAARPPSQPAAAHAYSPRLLPQHARLLAASAISPEVAGQRGYISVDDPTVLAAFGFSPAQCRAPGLLIPIHHADGRIAFHQYRPDEPRTRDGKPVKYETCAGAKMVLDVPPAVQPVLGDPSVRLLITEGSRKADAAVSAGLACVSLLGVWNWRGTNSVGGKTALADFELVALNGRHVDLAFDSDVMTKPAVHKALSRLWAFLESRGAKVGAIYLPEGPDDEKVGLDDFLADDQSVEDLMELREGRLRKPPTPGDQKRRVSQATQLVQLAAGLELFHTEDDRCFATMEVDGHKETHAIKRSAFRLWLRRQFWMATEGAPASQALYDAMGVLEGRALFDGQELDVHHRVAQGEDGAIYLDLGNKDWEAVRISAAGWDVVSVPPVRFHRPGTMRELPRPVKGGTLDALRRFVNVASDDDWRLLVGWLVGALRPRGPYPILILMGEQGSSKSTCARVIKRLVDPAKSDLRGRVYDEGDLMIACTNSWVVAVDNLSSLPDWLSDAMCRVATGAALTKRQLFTDEDEVVIAASRPLVLNGIAEFATRSDLLDRAIMIALAVIEGTHWEEDELYAALAAEQPGILGALLTVVSGALAAHPTTTVARLPRMADFARWVTAAEGALGWQKGSFLAAYTGNQQDVNATALEASPVGAVVYELVAEQGEWQGSATELLAELEGLAHERLLKQKSWPGSGAALSRLLNRIAPNLRRAGVGVEHTKEFGNGSRKLFRLTRLNGANSDARDARDAIGVETASRASALH